MAANAQKHLFDVVVIGAHPDDAELFAGGAVVRALDAGREVGIIHLTRGEMGTRGSAEERRTEALNAASILGLEENHVVFLDLGDTLLENTRDNQLGIIDVIRGWRPRLVLSHHPQDRHPDHRKASLLVEDSVFYSGLSRIETGRLPWRPNQHLRFFNNSAPDVLPSVVVDIGEVFERKMAAIAAYSSQFYNPTYKGPPTWISSPEFHEQLHVRSRYFGGLIGVSHGEPYMTKTPVPTLDLASLLF